MKEIITKCDLTDRGFTIIAERYQHIFQYGNCGAQLLHKGSAVVYIEDNGDFKTEYLLDKKEREAAINAPDKFLDSMICKWIDNEEDHTLSFYQWFPEEIKETYEDWEPCRVLIVGCYYGYDPIQWAQDETYENIVFSSPGDAEAWIEEQEKGPYYLQHGEAGRPEYFIIS